jgi:hypothetical protein
MAAYDAIMAEFKTDPNTVSALLDHAAKNPQHDNGIYNQNPGKSFSRLEIRLE